MPSIVIKSIDRIQSGDRLLVDAGAFAKAGRDIDDKVINLLVKHKTVYIPTIDATYEEKQAPDGSEVSEIIENEIRRRENTISRLRDKMIDKLKSIYIPYSETDSVFQVRGKKKQITKGILLESEPGILYQPEIDAGSVLLITPNNVNFLKECLTSFSSYFEKQKVNDKDTVKLKNTIQRQLFHSLRLHSYYGGEKVSSIGDAVPWQYLDIASLFLAVINNINKKRILMGAPLSEQRFEVDSNVNRETQFQYKSEIITDAALGILLAGIGFYHEKVHRVLSQRPILGKEGFTGREQIMLLKKSQNAARNLIRNRSDISSISRIMIAMQKEYPDGTGFPPLNENRYIHEFIRLFQIIHFYDEMTTPVMGSTMFPKIDVINYMKENSGQYNYSKDKVINNKKFDAYLLDEFLQILKPWDKGEKLSIFSKEYRNHRLFVGRVFAYTDSHIPLVSILKDDRTGKTFPYGALLLHVPTATFLEMNGRKIGRKKQLPGLSALRITESGIDSGEIREWEDVVYGKKRALKKGLRSD